MEKIEKIGTDQRNLVNKDYQKIKNNILTRRKEETKIGKINKRGDGSILTQIDKK